MSNCTVSSSLAEWVTSVPAAAAVLESYELDYCCGGRESLAAACAARGLDAAVVSVALEAAADNHDSAAPAPVDWSRASLTDLCDHIEQTHHVYLRTQFPRLEQLLGKVLSAHGGHHPELRAVAGQFRALVGELGPHLMKEEQILFPAIRRLEAADSPPRFPFGSVRNPIRMMEHEHDGAGHCLHELRRLTNGYAPPTDACATWRQLLLGLDALERDLHLHIHKENNLLFPAAARLEAAGSPAVAGRS